MWRFQKLVQTLFEYGVFLVPIFKLNMDIYSAYLRIQSYYKEIGTRQNSIFWHMLLSGRRKPYFFQDEFQFLIR